jgi:hypothetical protein
MELFHLGYMVRYLIYAENILNYAQQVQGLDNGHPLVL